MFHCGLLLVLFDVFFDAVGGVTQLEVDRHLQLGRDFLAKGQLQDALLQYHAAVEGDPNNYLTYYKRGTVYLALGKAKFALLDLEKVLDLKPDFTAARLQHGIVLLKQGQLDGATNDFLDVGKEFSVKMIEPLREEIATAKTLVKRGDCASAVPLITRIIESCPWSPSLRELRAECHVALGDYMNAISDIRSTTKLLSDNTEGYFKLSSLLYRLGQVDEALKEIRECLKLDPEHKECFPFYKKVKKVAKLLSDATTAQEVKDSGDCIRFANRVLQQEATVKNVRYTALHLLCKCYAADNKVSDAIKSCDEAFRIRKEPGILCDRAEAYLAGEMYDDAIRDYKEALELDPHFQRASEGLQRAQQRQKLSESRDYYKILDVPRTASKREIVKAYRKAAQKWHPDNFQDGEEKKRAEKKFIDIAAAKEVLTDEEKREKFDRGEDPLDPESGKHQQGFNPFREFHHFHGSPFQFKFHFN
ncbi:dnaJ homolog subfamily C member 3 [Belonocnema kinseyi]|uniref:dnaJ homolog subfamily C member 3 n=1 Tax=Belonocnema kinseyi TaxID=2817044 RepID=UPI00143D0E57|nr:dnaJ homolog subfamily C member 3 [Belonocnema kinseyi]